MTEQTTIVISEEMRQKEGKYLTFVLADEEDGLEILKVREIIGIMDITAVPRTPDFVKGVVNLRGKVIPVVDLRLKFGMEGAARTEETCIIVVDLGEVEMGIIVDKVSEVLDISAEDIDETPVFGSTVDTGFILGMGKIGDSVKILLDIEKVLGASEIAGIANLAEAEAAGSEEAPGVEVE